MQDAEVAVSGDLTTVLQPGDRARLHLKKKKLYKDLKTLSHVAWLRIDTLSVENH